MFAFLFAFFLGVIFAVYHLLSVFFVAGFNLADWRAVFLKTF